MMFTPQKLVVEIFLSNDSIVSGASHLYYARNKYEHYKIRGVFRKTDFTIYFIEDSTIAVKLGLLPSNCLGNYKMKLLVTDTAIYLNGRWTDKRNGIFKCPSSRVYLVKKIEKKVHNKEITKTDTIKVNTIDENRLQRKLDIQSLIELNKNEKDSIKFQIYDNGEIDGDYVSLYFNDSLIVYYKKISSKPITFFLSLNENIALNKVKLVAESLGSIPPCTALVVVTTKKKRYEVFLASKMQSNAVIEFFFKE